MSGEWNGTERREDPPPTNAEVMRVLNRMEAQFEKRFNKVDLVCERTSTLEAEVANIKEGHSCPMHNGIGERLTAVEIKSKGIDTLFKDRWQVAMAVIMAGSSFVGALVLIILKFERKI